MKYLYDVATILIFLATSLVAQSGWHWQNPLPQGNALFNIHFIDESIGTAVGREGTILRTTDGGTT